MKELLILQIVVDGGKPMQHVCVYESEEQGPWGLMQILKHPFLIVSVSDNNKVRLHVSGKVNRPLLLCGFCV